MAIDFMAIAKGRQLARNENWQDRVRAQQEEKYAIQRELWQDQIAERAINRESQAYVAPLISNMQMAASAGVTPVDFLIQQREQVMADPNFQNASPEVQQRILNTLGQTVRAQLQDLQRTGDFGSVQRLAQAYGLISPTTDIDVARAQGDPETILNATNAQFGSNFTLNPDGRTVTVAGVNVPVEQVAYAITQAGGQGAAALPVVTGTLQQQQQQALLDAQLAAYGFATGVPTGAAPPSLSNPSGIVPNQQTPVSPVRQAFGGAPIPTPPLAGAAQPTTPQTPNPTSPQYLGGNDWQDVVRRLQSGEMLGTPMPRGFGQ